MNDRLKHHIDRLFGGAPDTQMVREAREELLASCNDKYNDLIALGRTPDEAFNETVSGIGDVGELLGAVSAVGGFDPARVEKNRQRHALLTSGAIFFYIIGVAVFFVGGYFGWGEIGMIAMLIIAAFATFLMVYGTMTTQNTYQKQDDTMVEGIKEQLIEGNQGSATKKALISTVWSFIVIIYLAVSFLTRWWHITWMIFIVGILITTLIDFFALPAEKRSKRVSGVTWTATLLLYFILSFSTGRWDVTWLLFLVNIAVGQLMKLIQVWRAQP